MTDMTIGKVADVVGVGVGVARKSWASPCVRSLSCSRCVMQTVTRQTQVMYASGRWHFVGHHRTR